MSVVKFRLLWQKAGFSQGCLQEWTELVKSRVEVCVEMFKIVCGIGQIRASIIMRNILFLVLITCF